MEGYLGETILDGIKNPYNEYTVNDWTLYFIGAYGQIDGDHHKQWVLDQIARIQHGTPIIVKLAQWSNGHFEHRVSLGEPTKEYFDWVEEMKGELSGGEYEYDYDEGIAP